MKTLAILSSINSGVISNILRRCSRRPNYHSNILHARFFAHDAALPDAAKRNCLNSLFTCHFPRPTVSLPAVSWLSVRTYAKNKGKDKGGKGQKKVKLTSEQLEGLVDMEKVMQDLDRVLEDLKEKFIHQVTVRTSQGVFNNLTVKTPDGNFPLIQLGQVAQKSPQLVVVNLSSAPQYIQHVKEAFSDSGLNVNPQQDGTSLFVPIPKVTREHREGLAKNAKMLSEKSKKQLRDLYSKYSRKIKSSKDGHSADDLKAADEMVKDLMHNKLKEVDDMTQLKSQELMGGK